MSEKPVILFESYPDFSGSPLEIYNELVKRGYDKKYDLIWTVYANFNEKTNYKVVKFHGCNTSEKRAILARTKVIIDSNRYIQKPKLDVFRINVRHGGCLKRCIGYCQGVGQLDAIITTSKEILTYEKKEWPSSIHNKFIITGYPATDKIFSPKNLYECGFMKEITGTDEHFTKIISWFPTFRQHRGSPNAGSKKVFPFGIPLIKNTAEFDKLNDILKQNNILLLIHPHHAQAKNFTQLTDKSNIKFTNEHIKLKYGLANTDILGNSDALITDYSGAYHEYVILNRPIALTIDDLVEYSRTFGFILNYLEWIKGDYLLATDDLAKWVNDLAKGIDRSKNEREIALHKIHDHIDNKATERVVNYIIEKGKI
jgi:CDP-glycerol glycerophosphotransferase (TagB/SpsB family)